MASLYQIEKLDDTNYDSWCVQMCSVLIQNGLWKVVNGTVKKEDAADDRARESWEANDEKVLATIVLCVKSSILSII